MSSEEIGRASKAMWMWERWGSAGLIGGGRCGSERKPPV